MKELHSTILKNVGLLSLASIFLLPFVSAEAIRSNRCPKQSPYPFRNETYCCSRPVDFQWQNDGYCYGRTQKCTYAEGCVNYHPLCDFIDKIIAINFPSEEYNKIYEPSLLPTIEFSHKFIFKESSTEENAEIHCIWRNDVENWIIGLCKNIESNIGKYFLDTDSECPTNENNWKDIENNDNVGGNVKELKDRIVSGKKVPKSRVTGLFAASRSRNSRERVRKCVDWKRNPFTSKWRCFKFFPRKKKQRKLNKSGRRTQMQANTRVQDNNGVKLRNEVIEKPEENSNDIDTSESDYDIDSILSDIF